MKEKSKLIATICLAIALSALVPAQMALAESSDATLEAASVMRMPDVSEEMVHPSYWLAKQKDNSAVLADRATIDALNQAGINASGTALQPLKTAAERFYSQTEQLTLKGSVAAELADLIARGAKDITGAEITAADAENIVANCPADGSVPSIASGYAIVTTHTTMRCLPTDRMMGLTPGDKDDDNLYLSGLRVNEPLLIRAQSVDGNYFLCISTFMQTSWVPAKDIAICHNRDEWLAAWDIPAGEELVVTGYKVRTEQSRQTPNTANRMLYMGTVLPRIDLESPEDALRIVGTRSAYNNHVCYMPVRNSDGTLSREIALIAESAKVSEGFLPLTRENIANTAFESLGQMYGWGGMLEANDCSGYVRDVYKCFGLELARNTTWQMNLPVRKYDLSGLDNAHKAAAIAQMPLGTVLFFPGHEMMYLGHENKELYVISAVGSVGNPYSEEVGSTPVKGVIVNTLDTVRRNRSTWLSNIDCANIPYIPAAVEGPSIFDIAFYEDSITWPEGPFEYAGAAITPGATVPGLTEGEDYTVSYEHNVEPGTATVTVTGKGAYSGSASRTFQIFREEKKDDPVPAPDEKKDDPVPVPEKSCEMFRLYNPNSGEHFFTADAKERDVLVYVGWQYEGVGWIAPTTGKTPVYRLYNAVGGEHHYTTSADERDQLVAAGWSDEGEGWYSDDAQTVPLFREYNPNAFSNNHNYTASAAEHEYLISIGWLDEGVAWYGSAAS